MPRNRRIILAACCLLMLICCLSLFMISIGSVNQDLSRPEWIIEWLYAYPVPGRVLFCAKTAEYTVGNVFGWFVIAPFLAVFFFFAGVSWWVLPFSLLFCIYLLNIIACLRIITETVLKIHFSLGALRNMQAA